LTRLTSADTTIFHAGTCLEEGKVLTCGGRVIAASATADSLEKAVKGAYEGIKAIDFEGMFYRKDIADRFAFPIYLPVATFQGIKLTFSKSIRTDTGGRS
jgi:phosphoribosylamine--glycine ligase/phosphoribosylformylglycinamidine cyclo-ligase